MIHQHLAIGIIGVVWSAGMIYFAKKNKVPTIVKPFISTWWIKDKLINRRIALLLGYCSFVSSLLFIVGGLSGKKIWPFP